jgi:hypothetical protein
LQAPLCQQSKSHLQTCPSCEDACIVAPWCSEQLPPSWPEIGSEFSHIRGEHLWTEEVVRLAKTNYWTDSILPGAFSSTNK